MRSLFVTGTGTDIGKTYVSAAIARYFTKRNLAIAYYKAAVSGADSIEESDAGFVRDSAGIKQETSSLLSYLYKRPLSPHLAARIEGNFASLDKIKQDYLSLASKYDYVLSEGAGGIICPVVVESNQRIFYQDIIKTLGAPVVIVADAGLGTINHTILTFEYLKARNIKVQGVILNRFDKSSVMHLDNLKMIEDLSGIKVIATLANDALDLVLLQKPLEEYFDVIAS